MDNLEKALIQYIGIFMFIAAITLLLRYVSEYEKTYDRLDNIMKKDSVIINMEKNINE